MHEAAASAPCYKNCALLWLKNLNALDAISAREAIDDVHAFGDLSENRVAAIEMRLRPMGDENLAAARVFARQGHAR